MNQLEVTLKIPDHLVMSQLTFNIGANGVATAVATAQVAPIDEQDDFTEVKHADSDAEAKELATASTEPREDLDVTDEDVTREASEIKKAPQSTVLLEEFYLDHMQSQKLKGANKRTCKSHLSSAKVFGEFITAMYSGPASHVLETETDLYEQFARWLFSTRQNSVNTVGKRLMHTHMICQEMVRREVISAVKSHSVPPNYLAKLRRDILGETPEGQRRIPRLDEMAAIANAVDDTLDYPYKSDAPLFWQGWIQFCAMYGPRCRDVVSVDPDRSEKRGLRKSDIHFDSVCPIADVNAALGEELHSPHGWLHYQIGKDHKSDNKRILLPMSEGIATWIKRFIDLSPDDDDRVFPGIKLDSFLSQKPVSERWNSLLSKASVDPSIRLSEGKGNVLAVRKAAANWWKLQTEQRRGDTRLAENVADYLLHHSTTTVSQKHYLSVQASVLPVMLELLPTFPVLKYGLEQ